jgi:hypothetical protein
LPCQKRALSRETPPLGRDLAALLEIEQGAQAEQSGARQHEVVELSSRPSRCLCRSGAWSRSWQERAENWQKTNREQKLPLRVNGDSSFGSSWARILLGSRKSVFPVGWRSSVSSPADRFFVNIASRRHGRRQPKSRLSQSTRKPPLEEMGKNLPLIPTVSHAFWGRFIPLSGRLTFG